MFNIGDRVDVLTHDKEFIYDSWTITGITPESEENYWSFEVTLDGWKILSIPRNEIDRLQIEWHQESWIGWIKEIVNDKKKRIVAILIILAIIGGSIVLVRQHHATPKVVNVVTQTPEKTQIQKWTDEMAKLEQEKTDHYERQKYLRTEDKKEVDAVKKIDVKINKLKDKIHLYLTPADDE